MRVKVWCAVWLAAGAGALVVPPQVVNVRLTAGGVKGRQEERGGRLVLGAGSSQSAMMDVDALIEDLASTAPFELVGKVSKESVLRTVGRPQFFLRIAELCDEADPEERKKLEALADNLSATLSAVAERTQDRLEDASERLSTIVATAAEEDGEFLVPLAPEKLAALRAAVCSALESGSLDEQVLSTTSACAKKAEEDGLDGVVAILRKVLQLYAAETLAFDPATAAAQVGAAVGPEAAASIEQAQDAPAYRDAVDLYAELMAADADAWGSILQARLEPARPQGDDADDDAAPVVAATDDADDARPRVPKAQLLAVVQAQIERVVLLQENGSFAQRVQAEFLREIVARVEAVVPTTAQENVDLLSTFLDAADDSSA